MDFIKRPSLSVPALILAVFIMFPLSSMAETPAEVKALEEKVNRIEKKQAELYHSLEEKKAAGLAEKIGKHLSLGGLVEVEASSEKNDKTGDGSDVTLATVQLALDAAINEKVNGHIQLLWEEDTTDPIGMDEGTVTYSPNSALHVVGGKMYIPFGVFNTHFISDPLVLSLGETNESAAMARYVEGPVTLHAGVFNGSIDDSGGNDIQNYFASVSVKPVDYVEFGAYYTANLGDSDYMTTLLTSPVAETIPGFGGFIAASYGPYSFYGEYIRAKREFVAADLDANGDGLGDKPMAYNLELGMRFNGSIEVAAKYEGSEDLFSLPEGQYGAVVSYGLFENVTAKVEFLRGKYFDDAKRTLFTGQLAVEF